IIFHFHAGGLPEIYPALSPTLKKVFRFCYYRADHAICLNEAGLVDRIKLEILNTTIIPNGVDDLSSFKSKKNSDCFKVLFVGVCRETKGVIDFVRIVKRANVLNPKIKGVIVGKIYVEKEKTSIEEAVKVGCIDYIGIKTGDDKNNICASCHVLDRKSVV